VAVPSEGEIRYGLEKGILSTAEAVHMLEAQMSSGTALSAAGERIALLLRDEYEDAQSYVQEMSEQVAPPNDHFSDGALRYWIFVLLQIAVDRGEDPLQKLDAIYEAFDFDGEIVPLLRMPADPRPNEQITRSLESYLSDEAEFFASRGQTPEST